MHVPVKPKRIQRVIDQPFRHSRRRNQQMRSIRVDSSITLTSKIRMAVSGRNDIFLDIKILGNIRPYRASAGKGFEESDGKVDTPVHKRFVRVIARKGQ